MKVMTIVGTRPEIIRLCRIIEKLDGLCDQVLLHTGQNYDVNLKDIFFQQLGVREPDYYLGVRGTIGEQIGLILAEGERVMRAEKPDKVLVLGDTNSSLSAIIAKRLAIPVYHMEAGNRCYDDRVPEEVNRRIIDHSSDILLPYTERSRKNLLREGIPGERIYVTGNPIYEVIRYYDGRIAQSNILGDLGLESGKYLLVTMHREENVDVEDRLRKLTIAIDRLQKDYEIPVIVSTHPRTRKRMASFEVASNNDLIRYMEPFGFFEFITLERNALCVLSDSGTVQEECCIFRVPNVTLRDVTERPETLECGSNMLSGVDPDTVLQCVRTVLNARAQWNPPPEYLAENVSNAVIKILLGYRHNRLDRVGRHADDCPQASTANRESGD
jgi:UDP-N-acetylglucosamine 2-epimerase (non-hydrolysing)